MPFASRDQIRELTARAEREGVAAVGFGDAIGASEEQFTLAWNDGESQGLQDVWFTWDGISTVVFGSDIAHAQDGLTPMSSRPITGWANWFRSGEVFVAWACNDDQEFYGWAIVEDAAAYEDDDELGRPQWWINLFHAIEVAMVDAVWPTTESHASYHPAEDSGQS